MTKVYSSRRALFKYLLALLLFGTNGIVARQITLPSLDIVFYRTLFGSGLLVGIFLFSKHRQPVEANPAHVLFVLLSGVAMGGSWMFLYEAYRQIGVGIASLLYYCGPVLVMVHSPILFREPLTKEKLLGFSLVLSGILGINHSAFGSGSLSWGFTFGLLSALMYAFMVLFNKKATSIVGLKNATLQLVTSFLTVAMFLGFRQGLPQGIRTQDLLPVLILGLLNTGIGCYLYFSAIGQLTVQRVAVLGYLEPLSAVFFSALILQERLLPLQWIGGSLIILGAMVAEGLLRKTMIRSSM